MTLWKFLGRLYVKTSDSNIKQLLMPFWMNLYHFFLGWRGAIIRSILNEFQCTPILFRWMIYPTNNTQTGKIHITFIILPVLINCSNQLNYSFSVWDCMEAVKIYGLNCNTSMENQCFVGFLSGNGLFTLGTLYIFDNLH